VASLDGRVRGGGRGRGGGRLTLTQLLLKHRGEADFDFRTIIHKPLVKVAKEDEEEVFRLVAQLLKDTGTRLFAASAGWEHPFSRADFIMASVYSAWSGQPHHLMPKPSKPKVSDIENRLAEAALQRMKRKV